MYARARVYRDARVTCHYGANQRASWLANSQVRDLLYIKPWKLLREKSDAQWTKCREYLSLSCTLYEYRVGLLSFSLFLP